MSDPAPPLADAEARARALELARSFIVQAPAGSGKTTLLTQRYLVLLAQVERPEAVIAITFTKKAAAEMRGRVLEAFTAVVERTAPRHAADAATQALAAAVLARSAAAGWSLREQPARLRIQTIDSLCHGLAERLPILSRAGVSLDVEPRPAPLYAQAAERTLAELDTPGPLGEALAVVLGHLGNEADRLVALIADMLAARDRWLRLVVGSAGGTPDEALRAALEDALASLVGNALAVAGAAITADTGRRLLAVARGAAARLAATRPEFAALAAAPDWPLPVTAGALAAWQQLTELVLTAKGRWRAALTVKQGLPPSAPGDKAAMLGAIAELASVPALEAALAAIARLPPARYPEPEWRTLAALHVVLLAAAAELGAVFALHGQVDYTAVARAALEALGTPEEPTDLTLALDERIEHLLVDEFQDTSAAQVALLERLTAGWTGDDGRTLFLVGDPMQSIYRFRDANVGLFLRIRSLGLGALRPEPLTLQTNFRSRPALVDWFNRVFPVVLPAVEDLARGAVCYAPARATRAPAPAPSVELGILCDATAADEAAWIAAAVRRERAANGAVRIAVLGRSRAQLAPVAAALAALGIRYQGVELVPLGERLAVRDLVSLTRALCHLADRVAWLACLRAPWCGLDLAALAALAGDGGRGVIWEALADPARRARLAPAAAARVVRLQEVFGRALADRGRRPLAACVEATWLALGGPATLAEPADLDNARTFLARLDEMERAGDLDDPAALDLALADLYAAPDPAATEELQLLTVHRAKGLEWDVVMLPGLGRGARSASRRLLEWFEFARADGGPGLVLAPCLDRGRESEPLEQWLRRLAADQELLELGRLLYVASTRARERLYLVGHADPDPAAEGAIRPPRSGSLLDVLWPALEAEARSAARAVGPGAPPAGAPVPAPRLLSRLVDGWEAPPAPAPVVPVVDPGGAAGPSEFEFAWVTATARHVGTVVHEELERAAASADPLSVAVIGREPAWRRRLAELGVGPAQSAAAVARVRRALEATADDPRGAWLFDPAHRDAASELGLSTWRGGRLVAARIDRTFVDAAGVRWIVDFKTSEHEGTDLEAFLDQERLRYTAQLEQYALLVRGREPGRTIRLGLYFPLHAGWREWAPGDAPLGRPPG